MSALKVIRPGMRTENSQTGDIIEENSVTYTEFDGTGVIFFNKPVIDFHSPVKAKGPGSVNWIMNPEKPEAFPDKTGIILNYKGLLSILLFNT